MNLIDDDLNQKLSKHSQKLCVYTGEKAYVRTLGLKRGEGVWSKGGLFSGAYGTIQ